MTVGDTGKQRILIVHNYYQIPGGEDMVVANEKKLLEDHGHKVILYTRNNSELKSLDMLKKLFLPFLIIYNPQTVKEIRKIIKVNHINVIHIHNTLSLISPSVYYAARLCRVPVVQTIHNFRLLCPGATFYRDGHICEDCIEHGLRYAIKYNCYRKSRISTLACVISTWIHRMAGIYGKINYICLTEFNRSKLLYLKQIRPERVFVKPNFAETSKGFLPEEQRDDYFIFAGRLDKLKCIDLLLKAWNRLGESAPKLLVCGTGPMTEWCRDFIEKNKMNVELKGFIPNREVIKLIGSGKALILPTRWYEGFPMNIVEAYSVGTPVICSDLGNAGDIVIEGVTGWKFTEIDDLIDCVRKAEKQNLYKKTYSEYMSKYTEQINYESLLQIYRSLV